ncbi:Rbl2p, putative [Babesia ovis]|uniref:Tubulin-specific chaperone A n=1 Tax=Babesia ovis TaxID=5869 RepID=A0A9W5WTX3_BABOV|nr:Rbl2p, putative [Babesia ovis]
MVDELEVKTSAVKRLVREFSFYKDELDALRAALAKATDDSESKKFNLMVSENLAVMRSTRDKIAEYARDLREAGIEIPDDAMQVMATQL